jgi:6-phosphogluconolactonase
MNDALKELKAIDVLWLGIGEDGHTLSLFPGHPELHETDALAVAVRNAPKLPKERISMALPALKKVKNCIIFATGKGKADAMKQISANNKNLPIVKVIETIENSGGEVLLLVDNSAAEKL